MSSASNLNACAGAGSDNQTRHRVTSLPLADSQDGRAAGAEFDMFAEEAEPVAAPDNERKAATVAGLADSYDDAEGYYNLQV